MNLSEIKPKIIALVEEYENKGGITKNEACRILIEDNGGSRSTYWKGFDYLLGEKGGNLIESKIIPPNKQQGKLFPTESNKKLNQFRCKLEHVGIILDLVEKHHLIGDCYVNDIKKKKLTKFSTKFTTYVQQEADSIRLTNDKKYLDVYTLQARHDLVEKLPLFLYDYVNDPANELSEIKEDCLKYCNPFIERCLKLLQSDYANSPFFATSWGRERKSNTRIWKCKGQIIPRLEYEFLKILGRYYFLISKDLSPKFKIDSCNEQKMISNFTLSFYPRKKMLRGFNPAKKAIVESDDLYNYPWRSVSDLNTAELPVPVPEDANGVADTIGLQLMHGFYDDDFNDPAGIVEYYLNWIIRLRILSSVDLGVIVIIFMRGIVQNKLEQDRTDDKTKRLPNSLSF